MTTWDRCVARPVTGRRFVRDQHDTVACCRRGVGITSSQSTHAYWNRVVCRRVCRCRRLLRLGGADPQAGECLQPARRAADQGTTRMIAVAYELGAEVPLLLRRTPLPELPRLVAPAGLILQATGLGLRAWWMRCLGEFYCRTLRTDGYSAASSPATSTTAAARRSSSRSSVEATSHTWAAARSSGQPPSRTTPPLLALDEARA